MKTEYIPKFIMLLAGAVVCIVSIVRQMDTTYSLEILLAVLVLFYLIGCLARRIIEKVMTSNRFIKEVTEENDGEHTETPEPDGDTAESAESAQHL